MRSLLRRFAIWLLQHSEPTETGDPTKDAVYFAFKRVGLPEHMFSDEYDLVNANKFMDVYHLAARQLNIDPKMRTVADVVRSLKG